MGRVRILVGSGERIHHPRKPAILADHHIWVGIVGEKRSQGRYAIAHVAPHQQPALRVHVVAEGQLSQIAAVDRKQDAAQKAAELDAAVALIGGKTVALALGVIELLLSRLDVDVGVGQLAKIDLRARHAQAGHGALNRHVAQVEGRQPFRRKPVDGVHGDAVAVGINQLFVDPVAAALGQFVDVQLARSEHHLAQGAIDYIAIDVDIGKVVVGTDFLNLPQRVLQRLPIPQADVLQTSA